MVEPGGGGVMEEAMAQDARMRDWLIATGRADLVGRLVEDRVVEDRVEESIRYLELDSPVKLWLTFVQPDGSHHTDVIGPTEGRERIPIPAAFQGVFWERLRIRSEEQPSQLWEVSLAEPASAWRCFDLSATIPPAFHLWALSPAEPAQPPIDPWAAKPSPEPEGL